MRWIVNTEVFLLQRENNRRALDFFYLLRCPSFELRSDEVAATISVTADFLSSALKKWGDDLEKSADHYHAIVSEGHVRFPQALEESFSIPEHLNKKPDNVMYQTNFTRNVVRKRPYLANANKFGSFNST